MKIKLHSFSPDAPRFRAVRKATIEFEETLDIPAFAALANRTAQEL